MDSSVFLLLATAAVGAGVSLIATAVKHSGVVGTSSSAFRRLAASLFGLRLGRRELVCCRPLAVAAGDTVGCLFGVSRPVAASVLPVVLVDDPLSPDFNNVLARPDGFISEEGVCGILLATIRPGVDRTSLIGDFSRLLYDQYSINCFQLVLYRRRCVKYD